MSDGLGRREPAIALGIALDRQAQARQGIAGGSAIALHMNDDFAFVRPLSVFPKE